MTTAKDLTYPIVTWTRDSLFVSPTYLKSLRMARGSFEWLRDEARSGHSRLLDSSGRLYDITDEKIVSGSTFLERILKGFKVEPVLANERQLELEEFKKYVRKAVNARQRYDRGSYIVEDTMKKLPDARTYREAVEAIPEVF